MKNTTIAIDLAKSVFEIGISDPVPGMWPGIIGCHGRRFLRFWPHSHQRR